MVMLEKNQFDSILQLESGPQKWYPNSWFYIHITSVANVLAISWLMRSPFQPMNGPSISRRSSVKTTFVRERHSWKQGVSSYDFSIATCTVFLKGGILELPSFLQTYRNTCQSMRRMCFQFPPSIPIAPLPRGNQVGWSGWLFTFCQVQSPRISAGDCEETCWSNIFHGWSFLGWVK